MMRAEHFSWFRKHSPTRVDSKIANVCCRVPGCRQLQFEQAGRDVGQGFGSEVSFDAVAHPMDGHRIVREIRMSCRLMV